MHSTITTAGSGLALGVEDLEDLDTPEDYPWREFLAGVAVGVAIGVIAT